MTYIQVMATYVRAKLGSALSNEKGEVNIIAIVVLIGIAIILAVVFKNQVKGLLTTLFTTLEGEGKNAITNKG